MFGGIGRALSHRDYCIYWTSNGINTVGRWMYRIAVGWLTWELTESFTWLGIVAFAESFPLVVFSVLAGAIADRIGYIRITILAQTATAIVAAGFAVLTLAGIITIELVLISALLIGSLESLTTPARMALVHALVPKQDLSAAIALGSATFNAARFIGPAIAGGLLVWAGSGVVLAVVAIAFAQFCVILLIVNADEPERNPGPWRDLAGDIVTGIRYGFGHPGIRYLLIMLAVTGLLIRPVIELMPGFSADVFNRGADGLAILMSTLGFGAMVSCIWVAQRGRTEGLTRLVTASLLVQGVALVMCTLVGHFLGNLWIAAACFGVVGFAMLIGGVGSQTLMQNAVESHMRARVMSLFIMISWGLPAFGALAAGWIANFAGLPITIGVGGILTIGLWLWARPKAAALQAALEKTP
jgi:MFS family permease